MLTDRQRLERYLGTAGAIDTARMPLDDRLARRIFAEEVRHEPPADFSAPPLERREEVDAFTERVRADMNAFVAELSVLGSQTESYRLLGAHASVTGRAVAPQVIAECIATYRLLLGREPDVGGFDQFVTVRQSNGLVQAVRETLASAEATAYIAPDAPASIDIAVLAVTTAAISILNSAVTDVTLGIVAAMRTSFSQLFGRIDAIGATVEDIANLSRLRFDGNAHNS